MFMQELWAIRLDWDDELPDSLKSRWINFIYHFENVSAIAVPWFVSRYELVYCRTRSSRIFRRFSICARCDRLSSRCHTQWYSMTLISAKTRITPLKRITIPRLLLSAAVLLMKQLIKVREVLELHRMPAYLWTDSTVALAWIKSHPSRWKEFIKNSILFIQELSNSRWYHISGKENPADLASRGIYPQRLQKLWWNGSQCYINSRLRSLSHYQYRLLTHLEERARNCAVAIMRPEPVGSFPKIFLSHYFNSHYCLDLTRSRA